MHSGLVIPKPWRTWPRSLRYESMILRFSTMVSRARRAADEAVLECGHWPRSTTHPVLLTLISLFDRHRALEPVDHRRRQRDAVVGETMIAVDGHAGELASVLGADCIGELLVLFAVAMGGAYHQHGRLRHRVARGGEATHAMAADEQAARIDAVLGGIVGLAQEGHRRCSILDRAGNAETAGGTPTAAIVHRQHVPPGAPDRLRQIEILLIAR